MAESEGIWIVCPRCGASNLPNRVDCFLCGLSLVSTRSAPPDREDGLVELLPADRANPYAAPKVPVAMGPTFRISTLLLVIAAIAVCLGVIHEAPGLGIPLGVLSFAALGRTVVVANRGLQRGHALSLPDKIAVFLATVGIGVVIMICIVIAVVAALFALCMFAGGGSTDVTVPAMGLGAVVLGLGTIWGSVLVVRRLGRVRTIGDDLMKS
jgi:hypothetical protein